MRIRKHKGETELRFIADRISEEIMIREYVNGNSNDIRRESSNQEKEIIFKVVFGALLGLNWGEDTRSSQKVEQGIIDTAEYTIGLFIPGCNGYDTVYLPLKKVIQEWEVE